MEAAQWGPMLVLLLALGTPMVTDGKECSDSNNSTCEQCLKNVTCLWCSTTKECKDYPVRSTLPPSSVCKLSAARWGLCWVNFEALIITMSVVGAVLILSLVACCFCCCWKKSRKPDKEDEKAAREKEQRQIRQEERRSEMKSRHDEIRNKYGLFKEDNPYAKFDN